MENRTKNIIMSVMFFLFIVALIIGGYIYVSDLSKTNNKTNKISEKRKKDYRIDKTKDYIYFENEELISADPEITYSDIVLNVLGAEIINSTLKEEMNEIRSSVVKLNETNREEREPLYSESDIYSAKERVYKLYKNKSYYSVVISNLDFNCYDDFSVNNILGYVIELSTGNILTNENIIEKYNLNVEDIKNKVSAKLVEEQGTNEEGKPIINVEETLNTLFDNYVLYIDNSNVYISFIVKTNFVNYNESVVLN